MPNMWEQLAMQTAGGVIGAGMGIAMQGQQDRRQLRQQRKLQELEISGQQQMGEYNYGQQMRLWNDTNYQAQMNQIKKAGLNPALIYSGGGPGGTTQIQPGNVSGTEAPKGGHEIQEATAMGIQMAAIAAQTEKTKAETKKIETELPNIPKTGENIDSQTALNNANTMVKDMEFQLAKGTLGWNKEIQYEKLVQLGQQNRALSVAADVAEATQQQQIKKAQAELDDIAARIALQGAMKGKSEAEITNMVGELKNKLDILKNEQDRTKIQQQLADFQTKWGDTSGEISKQVIGYLLKFIPGSK